MPRSASRVSVVVVTYNSSSTIGRCLESVLATCPASVVVVDNASSDGTPDLVEELGRNTDRLQLVRSAENLGFSAASNLGARRLEHDVVVLLNPDTVVRDRWLEGLLDAFDHAPNVGAVGPISNYVAGQQQVQLWLSTATLDGHEEVSRLASERYAGTSLPTRLLIGFCLAIDGPAFAAIDGLDDDLFLGNDDLDVSWRLRLAGRELRIAPSVYVEHVGQVSFKSEPKERVDRLVQESTDHLAEKLLAAYGAGQVPRPEELWGIGWFEPSRSLWP